MHTFKFDSQNNHFSQKDNKGTRKYCFFFWFSVSTINKYTPYFITSSCDITVLGQLKFFLKYVNNAKY